MNKVRREALSKLQMKIIEIKEEIETLLDEETEYYDNMPEGLQGGSKGEAASTAIDNIQSAIDSLDEVGGVLEEAQS